MMWSQESKNSRCTKLLIPRIMPLKLKLQEDKNLWNYLYQARKHDFLNKYSVKIKTIFPVTFHLLSPVQLVTHVDILSMQDIVLKPQNSMIYSTFFTLFSSCSLLLLNSVLFLCSKINQSMLKCFLIRTKAWISWR